MLVINTVLSAMSYNYPLEKLNVYLSDDGGSEFTFYALIEAAKFSKRWIPFCKKFSVEPRSPEVFFAANLGLGDDEYAQRLLDIKVWDFRVYNLYSHILFFSLYILLCIFVGIWIIQLNCFYLKMENVIL